MGYIYTLLFPNGMMYVGQTIREPEDRWGPNGKGYEPGTLVRAAVDEFGWPNVVKKRYEYPNEELDYWERYWIAKYHSNDPKYGYNIHSGGKKGSTLPDSFKEKMSQNRREFFKRRKMIWGY
jgi:hypothetical protein